MPPAALHDPEQLKELLGIPFSPEQIAAITADLAPGVIIAGAGSGKTTVMTARVVWLVGTGAVRPDQVLGLTFTNKAAGELAERVRSALRKVGAGPVAGAPAAGGPVAGVAAAGFPGSGPVVVAPDADEAGEPTVSTYHSFAGRLLQEHGLRIGLEPSARLLADATRFQLAARAARRAPGPFPSLTGTLAQVAADVLTLSGELAEHLVGPETLVAFDEEFLARVEAQDRPSAGAREAADAARVRLDLARLAAAYRDAKAARDLLDFGDQIALAARLVEERPEVGEILRATYRVVLLDEYQDTSVAQRRLLAGLFGRPEGADAGHGHPVTAVGDPCQAIYGWRGASVDNLLSFHEHFPAAPAGPGGPGEPAAGSGSPGVPAEPGPPAASAAPVPSAEPGPPAAFAASAAPGPPAGPPRVFRLGENRRSGGRILAFANDLAADLPERRDGVVVPLRPGPGADHEGWSRCALLPTYDEEIAWLADQIRHVLDTFRTARGEPVAPRDIAVLARTAADFADIHAALVARDVPVEVVGLSGLLHLPEVADLVAMCEVLDDPTANTALVRLLAGPRWRIGPRDLALLGRRAAELVRVERGTASTPDARLAEAVAGVDPTEVVSLSDALDDLGPGPYSAEARRRFERLASEIRHLRAHLGEPLMDVLHRVLVVTGLDVELSASPGALAARRRETLHAFLDTAAGFADLDGDPSLTAFLAFLRTAAEHDNGLDGSLPSAGDSVKVLTAHRSKGLEWAVVAVPGLVAGTFPSTRAADRWTKTGKALPHALRGDRAALPDLDGLTPKDFKAFEAAMKEHRRTEELRLGYVTFTRPKDLLIASGHWWGPTQKKRRGPSPFLERLRDHCEAGHGDVVTWADEPEETANPHLERRPDHAWPLPLSAGALAARRRAAAMVLAELERRRAAAPRAAADPQGREGGNGGRAAQGGHGTRTGGDAETAAGHAPVPPAPQGPDDAWDPSWPVEPPDDEADYDLYHEAGEPDHDPADLDHEPDYDPGEDPDHEPADEPDHEPDHEPVGSAGPVESDEPPFELDDEPVGPVESAGPPFAPEDEPPFGPEDDPWWAEAGGLYGPYGDTPPFPHARPAPAGAGTDAPVADAARVPPARSMPGDPRVPGPAVVPHTDPATANTATANTDPATANSTTGTTTTGTTTTGTTTTANAGTATMPAREAPGPRPHPDGTPSTPDGSPGSTSDGTPGSTSYGTPEDDSADPVAAARAALRLPPPSPRLDPADRARIRSWDDDLVRLAGELRRSRSGVREVELPLSLSASQMLRLASDPDGLARELARPMPRPPAPAARRGTRFHAWVEAQFDQQPLLDPEDLPGAADEEIADEADLRALQDAFLRTPYARRAPYRIEAPFQLVLGGRVVRGRIDAVYRDADGRFEVVDWKTGRAHTADPLQLAVYRLAWAETAGVDPEEVTATFLYVRTGEVVRPTGLPGRDALELLLAADPP